MTDRKQSFAPDLRKCGYLKVGRSQLKALFSTNAEQQQLAKILLCVQTFAYFNEGQIYTSNGVYVCHAGEWISCYWEISLLTGIDRRLVKSRLKKLEVMGFLTVEHMSVYKRISLTNYEQRMLIVHNPSFGGSPKVTAEEVQGSLFQSASSLYSPSQMIGEA